MTDKYAHAITNELKTLNKNFENLIKELRKSRELITPKELDEEIEPKLITDDQEN